MHYRVLRKYVSKNLFGCQESKINQKQSNQHGEPRCKRARIHPIFAKNTVSSCATRIYLYLSRQDIGTSIIANTGVTGVFSIDPSVQINTTMAIQKSKYRISSSRSTDFTRVSLLPLLLNFFLVSVILHTTHFCFCLCYC
jgi:hypothetical protein